MSASTYHALSVRFIGDRSGGSANESVMPLFMFCFGFMSPGEQRGYEMHGWDGESSQAVLIVAGTAEEATAWGREIAEWFVRIAFENADWIGETPSWKADGYAHWLEEDPESIRAILAARRIPVVRAHDYPDWAAMWDQ